MNFSELLLDLAFQTNYKIIYYSMEYSLYCFCSAGGALVKFCEKSYYRTRTLDIIQNELFK